MAVSFVLQAVAVVASAEMWYNDPVSTMRVANAVGEGKERANILPAMSLFLSILLFLKEMHGRLKKG